MLREIKLRHSGRLRSPVIDDHQHYTRWTSGTFVQMSRYHGFNVVDVQDPDDKVGNGFTVVIDVAPSFIVGTKCWWTGQTMKVRQKAFELITPRPPLDLGGD